MGSTAASNGSEKTISTDAVRDTPSIPGGGAMETIWGGPPSRISCATSLSLPSGPAKVPPVEATAWPFWLRAVTV